MFVLMFLSLVCFVLSILFVVYLFIFLSSVPNRLNEISFYMRKIAEAMENLNSKDD